MLSFRGIRRMYRNERYAKKQVHVTYEKLGATIAAYFVVVV